MRRCRNIAFSILVAAALGTTARGDDTANQTTAAARSSYSTKLICKREAVTGSMIPKRVCKTQEQIDREREALKQYGDEMRRSTTAAPTTMPGALPSDHAGG